MKQKLISILILFSFIALAAPTRKQLKLLKNDVVTVKATLKSGKELAKSEATLRKYLNDSTYAADNVELQQLLCDVLKKAYQIGNEKMYLKEKADTACLIKTGCRMFLAYQKLDSLNANNRNRNSQYLLPYRTNTFMGGLYFIHHKEWTDAWQCLDIYLQCPHEPLFSNCKLTDNDQITYKVAFLSLVAATHLDSLSLAMKYAPLSIRSNHRDRALELLAEITLKHKDSINYERFLRMGFKDFPKSNYFFPHLIDLLDDNGIDDDAMALCDKALELDSMNTMYLLAKHNLLMNTRHYDEAIKVGDRIIAINDSIDTPYYNLGAIYHQRAMETLCQKGKPYRQRLANAQKLFRICRKYTEKYRKLSPHDRQHWRPILYDVYLNLNMGKEFREVEK